LSSIHLTPLGTATKRLLLLLLLLLVGVQVGFLVLSACVLVAIAVPIILPVFLPLAVAFVWLRKRYLSASREVKRWEATTR
jgi:hypothetical protein